MGRNSRVSTASGTITNRGLSLQTVRAWIIACRFPLALALLPFLLFWPLTLVHQTWYVHDIQHYFFSYHTASANILRSGSLPLWNPYAFSGIPLLGDGQTAMFYPPNWLFFVLPGAAGLNYALLLQFSIAGVGMYGCARSWGLGRWPAAIAALAFMFGGMITARVVHLSIMSGVALMPWLVWFTDNALNWERQTGRSEERSPLVWFVAAAAVAALQVFAGHPQVPVYTAVALGILALMRATEASTTQRTWRPLLWYPLRLAGIYTLGYGLAGIQLVPWVELGLQSPRAAGTTFEFVMGSGVAGTDWLLWLFPYVYGSLHTGMFADSPMPIALSVRAWEHSAYVGVPTVALALVGIGAFANTTASLFRPAATSADKERTITVHQWWTLLFLIMLLGLGLLTAAGKHTPFADLVYATPVVGKLRAVERTLVLAAFALPMLAAFGMQWLTEEQIRHRLTATISLLAGGLLVVIVAYWIWFAGQQGVDQQLFITPEQIALLQLPRANALVPLALATTTLLLLAAWAFRLPNRVAHWLLTALLVVDMGIYAITFNPTTDASIYRYQPQVLQALQGNEQPFRKATVLLTTNNLPLPAAQETLAVSWGMVYGIEDINGFNSLQPRRYTDYVFGTEQTDVSYAFLPNQQLLQPDNPILSSLNVRYVLVPTAGPQPVLGSNLVERYSNKDVRVYENTAVWPRAFFPEQVRAETDPQRVLQTVTAPGFDGRRETLVESAALPELVANSQASTQITKYEPNQIELRTQTAEQRLLVLSEMYFPGWHATVDGTEVPIERANYLFRAVMVPAGEHTVTFSYRPLSAVIGLVVSTVGLALAVLLLWLATKPQRTVRSR